ncbi:MAG: multidrug effflux MFS transporter [Parerythrobacter sp.]
MSATATSPDAAAMRKPLGERELIALMAALMSLQAFGIDSMLPAIGRVAGELGARGNSRQLIIGLYLIGTGFGALFPGVLADRFGRRPVLAFGLTAYVSFSFACAFVSSFPVLLVLRFLQGLLCASMAVVPAAIVRDHVGGDRMARLMSLIIMMFLAVPVIAPFIGQIIMELFGWRAIFGAMALLGGSVAVWMWVRLPETLTEANRQPIDLRAIGSNMTAALVNRGAIGYVVGSALVFGSLFGFLNSAEQLVSETFDQADNFAFIFGGAVLGMVAASFTNSRIVERFGARRVSHTALLGFITITVVQLWSASNQPQPLYQFVGLMTLVMAMLGFIGANFSSIAMQPFAAIAGAASSAQTGLRTGLGAILGAIIGSMYDGTARPLAVSMLSLGLLALAVVLFSERGKLFARRNLPG